MSDIDAMNKVLEGSVPALPRYQYFIVDHGEEPIITFAPLHVGDTIRVKENGELRSRKIASIEFLEITANAGAGLYTPFVTFEVEGAH